MTPTSRKDSMRGTMTSMECLLEVMEQPAERVKFRTEVKGIFSKLKILILKIQFGNSLKHLKIRYMDIVASSESYFLDG